MEDNNICVYFHINSETKEVFYVGIGSIKRPYDTHKRSDFWNRTVKKYGYDINIIHTNLTWEEAVEYEKKYIKEFGRRNLGTGSLVNLTDGGEGCLNMKHSEESKGLMSKNKIGKKPSDETKSKMSKNRPKVSVEQLDLSSNVLNVFDAVRYAESSTGVDRSSIIRVCKGKVNTAGGFKWRYSNTTKTIIND